MYYRLPFLWQERWMKNPAISACPDTEPLGTSAATHCCALVPLFQFKIPLNCHIFQCFSVLRFPPSSPTSKGSKSEGHLVLLITFTDNLHRKEINTFLRSYSDNKSCVSSHQSWVWRVQAAVAPRLLQFQGTGPGCDFILISTSVWATECFPGNLPAALLKWICIPPKETCICLVRFSNSLLVGPHIKVA